MNHFDIDIIGGMSEKGAKRHEHWQYQYCIPREMPKLPLPADRLLLGTYSACHCRALIRCVNLSFTYNLYPTGSDTISSMARDYLEVKYPKRNRIFFAQSKTLHYMPVPLMSVPTYPDELFDGTYIDLKRAYWQIVRTVGWDVDFYPGRWIGVKSENEDYPLLENKLATNILVSSCLPSTMRMIDEHGKQVSKTTYNRNLNMQLHMLTMLLLHAVAQIANSYGAVYVNTDGAIVPTEYAYDCIQDIRDKVGLLSRVKHQGFTVVKAVGAYMVGHVQTKRFHMTKHYHRHRNLYPDDDLLVWTREQFCKLAKSRNPYIQGDYHERTSTEFGKAKQDAMSKMRRVLRSMEENEKQPPPIYLSL